ncbi:MAG: acetolactate synthase small subunit [Candidatus Omnitrophica bacterium]|nr:acetolactate synthase small subunit [Candidatus Omnitrophota bacterium]
MKHTIGILVENHFGVLTRVSGLFSARGFNISSLAVGETEDPTISRMTIVVDGDERILEQIMKQLNKLIDVIKVADLTQEDSIDRELALIKVAVTPATRAEIIQIVNTFRSKIVDVNPRTLTIEMTGPEGKIDALIELMKPFGILEVVNTGIIAIARASELRFNTAKQGPAGKAKTATKKKTAKAKKK